MSESLIELLCIKVVSVSNSGAGPAVLQWQVICWSEDFWQILSSSYMMRIFHKDCSHDVTHSLPLIDLYFPLYKERNHKKENISRNTIQRVLAHKQYSCIKHWTFDNNKNIQKKIIMRGTRTCDPFQ